MVAAVFIIVNILAFHHAGSMMNFSPDGRRTKSIEDLSFFERAKAAVLGVNLPKPQNRKTPVDFDLPFTTHRYDSESGYELEAWHIPADSASRMMIFFHGYASSKDGLLAPAAYFHELGYNSLLVDFFGSGGSSGQSTSIGYLEARDVVASVRFAQEQWPEQELVLYGISMGGAAITRALHENDLPIKAVVLESTYDSLLGTTRRRFSSMGLPAFPFAELLIFWGSVRLGFNGFAFNPADYASSITAPTLVLHGELDPRVTEADARRVFANLAGPKYFHSFTDVGHTTFARAAAVEWQIQIKRFFQQH